MYLVQSCIRSCNNLSRSRSLDVRVKHFENRLFCSLQTMKFWICTSLSWPHSPLLAWYYIDRKTIYYTRTLKSWSHMPALPWRVGVPGLRKYPLSHSQSICALIVVPYYVVEVSLQVYLSLSHNNNMFGWGGFSHIIRNFLSHDIPAKITFSPNSICSCVFTTSKGVVSVAAIWK